MPRFSVIIPIYKSGKFLPWTIDSLRAQTFQDWEAILVDDGSGQETVTRAIAAAVESDPRIRAAPLAENRGVSAARNRGLAEANGEYLMFLDSDDLLLPWSLATFDEAIIRENEPAFLVGSSVAIGEDDSRAEAQPGQLGYDMHEDYLAYRAEVKTWWFNPSGAVMRASEVRKAGGFWSSRLLCEDIDLWQRLGTAPGFLHIGSPHTYAYRIHPGGAHHGFQNLYDGMKLMLKAEKTGLYPGGVARARQRIAVISAHARHHAVEFSKTHPALAWKLYFRSVRWNLKLGRWSFLMAFPFLFLARVLRPR